MQTGVTDSFLKIIETLAPYIFGGSGLLALYLKYFIDKESKKIANTEERLARSEQLESLCRHQEDALQAIISQCDSVDVLGQTFETSEVTPKQLIYMKTAIDRIRGHAEDVLEDGVFRNKSRKNDRSR